MSTGLSYYNDTNKVESTLLKTEYTCETLSKYIRKYTRVRTKNYSYIGMNKATAKSCVDAKTALYKRTYGTWIQQWDGSWNYNTTNEYKYKEVVAGIEASKQDGSLWNVDIQVNEICVVYYKSVEELPDPTNIFETYFPSTIWKYDEDGE